MIKRLYRCIVPVLLLAAGIGGMLAMAVLKKEIPRDEQPGHALNVSVMEARPENLTVTLKGYGQVRVVNSVIVSPEVRGRLIYVNPKLEPGETISKGDLLLKIDDTNFQHTFREQAAAKDRLESRIQALEVQQSTDSARYRIAMRSRDLAKSEYLRINMLFEKRVGSKSQVEAAEQALNRAKDLAAELSGAVQTFPFALNQARSDLEQTLVRMASAREDIHRCRVYAPFDCRVKASAVEAGQFVTPGQKMACLADDTVLEINVSLDSRDARQWLRFDPEPGGSSAWFSGLKQVDCRIYWTDDRTDRFSKGVVHRMVEFNPGMRSLVIAVRLEQGGEPGLLEGMFCRVEIPGRTMENVFRLPGSAVGAENKVFLADQGRVKATRVAVIHTRGQDTFVSEGLTPGDRIILTPLADSAEHAQLNVIPKKEGVNQ